jgi:aminoglycoside 6'-N-acetyltransferase I
MSLGAGIRAVATCIRPIGVLDVMEVIRMRSCLWPNCRIEDHATETHAMFSEKIEATIFVADRGGGALGGFIEVRLRAYAEGCASSPVGYIEGWYVDEDIRLRGIGAALVSAAEVWARAHGCREMASDTEVENKRGQAAHSRLGYDEVERVVLYRRCLGPPSR